MSRCMFQGIADLLEFLGNATQLLINPQINLRGLERNPPRRVFVNGKRDLLCRQRTLAQVQEPSPRAVNPCGGRGCRCRARWRLDGFVGNGVGFSGAGVDVQAAAFIAVQGARTAAAEDGDLIAGFVDGAVAVDPFEMARAGPRVWAVAMSFGIGRGLKPKKWPGSSQGDTICRTRRPFLPSAAKANVLPATMPTFTSLRSLSWPSAVKN